MDNDHMSRTVCLNIDISDEEKDRILVTKEYYSEIYNEHAQWFVDNRTTSTTKAHEALYHDLTQRYPDLPTAIIQVARDNAASNIKSYNKNNPKNKFGKVPQHRARSFKCDKRTVTLNQSGKLTFSLAHGKRGTAQVEIPKFFTNRYGDWVFKSAIIGVNKNGVPFANLIYRKVKTKPKDKGRVVGLDRGIYNLISTSDGVNYSSSKVRGIKRKRQYNRKTLKAKVAQGSRSAKRRLVAMEDREARFSRDVNHCLSKELAEDSSVSTYVLEDLEGIRKRVNKKGGPKKKKLNRMLSNWSFAELEQFLTYKCEANGITVVLVDPAYTSQKCSSCGITDKSHRKGSVYRCKSCGMVKHADINAAQNIRDKHITSLPGS